MLQWLAALRRPAMARTWLTVMAAAIALPSGTVCARERTSAAAFLAMEPIPTAQAVVEIRVHGNQSLPDAEVLALAGVTVGDPAGTDLEETVRKRLEASGRFETVEVRRLYRSLTATNRVALVIVVRERPGARFSNPVSTVIQISPTCGHRKFPHPWFIKR